MPTANDPSAIDRARTLRRKMTDGEKKLWAELREFRRWYGVHVRRQAPIGPYVVDFAIQKGKLVIEIDGEHHQLAEQARRDIRRDAWLKAEGYEVLRLSSGDVWDNFDGCVEEILRKIGVA